MFDDLEILRDNPLLQKLFFHYAQLGETNGAAWQARLMQMEGVDAAELTRLHGELIACDWIEQNTGQVPCCYRLTLTGARALGQLQCPEDDESLVVRDFENQAA